jgi:hypothetical protein
MAQQLLRQLLQKLLRRWRKNRGATQQLRAARKHERELAGCTDDYEAQWHTDERHDYTSEARGSDKCPAQAGYDTDNKKRAKPKQKSTLHAQSALLLHLAFHAVKTSNKPNSTRHAPPTLSHVPQRWCQCRHFAVRTASRLTGGLRKPQ